MPRVFLSLRSTHALLWLAIAALSPRLPAAISESFTLGLGIDGSALEAAFFAHRWLLEHPTEKVTLVDLGAPNEARMKDTVALYSNNGQLKVHLPGATPRVVEGLTLGDLTDENKCRDVLKPMLGPVAAHRSLANTETPKDISSLVDLMAKVDEGSFFPYAASKVLFTRTNPDGTKVEDIADCFVFDFCDQHFVWRLPGYPYRQRLPKDTRFGGIHPCVRYGDMVDAILMKAASAHTKSNEKARLSFPGFASGGPSVGSAALIIPENGSLTLYNAFVGTLPIPGTVEKDIENPVFISWIAWQALSNHLKSESGDSDGPVSVSIDQLYNKVEPVFPMRATSDTQVNQIRRLRQLLVAAGMPTELDEDLGILRFDFEGRSFGYAYARGGWVESPTSTPNDRDQVRPSRLLVIQGNHFSLLKRSEDGNPFDTRDLGTLLLQGNEVPIDEVLGLRYLSAAFDRGDTLAALEIGRYYLDHWSEGKDMTYAAKCYKAAAEDGFPEAAFNFGQILAYGKGIKAEPIEGLAWMILGDHTWETKDLLTKFRKDFSEHPEWIETATARAEELRKQIKRKEAQPSST